MDTTTPITGFTRGPVGAAALSWAANKSILWAILHGFLSWLYVQDQRGSEFDEAGTVDASGNYHMLDYPLFYMNIRNNAKLRTNRYMAQ